MIVYRRSVAFVEIEHRFVFHNITADFVNFLIQFLRLLALLILAVELRFAYYDRLRFTITTPAPFKRLSSNEVHATETGTMQIDTLRSYLQPIIEVIEVFNFITFVN